MSYQAMQDALHAAMVARWDEDDRDDDRIRHLAALLTTNDEESE